MDDESVRTEEANGRNPNYQFTKLYNLRKVTKHFIEHLEHSQLAIQIFGRQDASKVSTLNFDTPEMEFNRLLNEKDSKIEELRGKIEDRDIKLNKIADLLKGRKDELSVNIMKIVGVEN